MAYQVLYREWRPRTFADVIGQDHIVRTLGNALKTGRIAHAYIFCGPRGTGKTTVAKLLAAAVNCASPAGFEPCGSCEMCRDIGSGASMDVSEIDAASNRGIDEIRDLREKVRLAPAYGRHRVFIIDEVHMLTNEAFNALLKTLEEPPANVIFILATTEPHRVPLTILSRCQRFDFHRINDEAMKTRLGVVAKGAGIVIDKAALDMIVRASDGGLRDALGVLDQAAAYGGNNVTADEVHRILGTVREELLKAALEAMGKGNGGELLGMVGQVVDQGKDLRLFIKELNLCVRQRMLDLVRSGQSAGREVGVLSNVLGILAKTDQDMRWSTQPRILLEVALVRAARAFMPGEESGSEPVKIPQVTPAVSETENPSPGSTGLLKKKAGSSRRAAAGVRPEASQPGAILLQAEKSLSGGERDVPAGLRDIEIRWGDIIEAARRSYPNIASYLVQGRAWPFALDKDLLTIAFPRSNTYAGLAMSMLDDNRNRSDLAGLIRSLCRKDLKIRLMLSEMKPPQPGQETVEPNQTDIGALFGIEEEVPAGDFEDL